MTDGFIKLFNFNEYQNMIYNVVFKLIFGYPIAQVRKYIFTKLSPL